MAKVVNLIFLTLIVYSVVYGSRKKGVAVSPRAYKCGDLDVLDNIAWWYDWGANFNLIEEKSGCDLQPYVDKYVPMIWGYGPKWFGNSYYIEGSSPFLLAFNEPNHRHQANLTAQEAVDGWPTVEHYANGRAIVSPAAGKSGGKGNHTKDAKKWFGEFFGILCQNETTSPCRVSYLATHIYSRKCSTKRIMRFLRSLWKRYKLKIWLTEFACPYTTRASEQLAFMQELLPRLEKAEYIYRYAWFVHRAESPSEFVTESANLFEPDSSTLTTLGQYYRNFTWKDPGSVRCRKRKNREWMDVT